MKTSFYLIAALALLGLSACYQSSTISEEKGVSTPVAVSGEVLNKFFPKDEEGFDVVFTQEKEAFSQAKLNDSDGNELATLTITDALTNQKVLDNFKASQAMISGYPAINRGSKGTAVLVADRFQVQVRSKADSIGEPERAAWISKFDLDGLAKAGN